MGAAAPLSAILHVIVANPLLFWLLQAIRGGTASLLKVLQVVSHHTGVPVVVVAAAALVISLRMARRAARLGFEMAIALGLILAATKVGWIHW